MLLLFIAGVIWRLPAAIERQKTGEQIAKIRATKLTIDDVMGVNLPLPPDPELKDATIAGFDSNRNGIRDDVELAIFEAYPDSARTRAALLQYALALQTQMTLEVVNKKTFVATIEDMDTRALNCLWSLFSRDDLEKFIEETTRYEDFIKELQYNTEQRKRAIKELYEQNLDSFSASRGGCDIDPSFLPN